MSVKILGYDCRPVQNDENLAGLWTDRRRQKYLLNQDVHFPLSVDRVVWPSLFHFESEAAEKKTFPLIHIKPADFHQQGLRLWKSLSGLQETIKRSENVAPHAYSVICITLEDSNLIQNDERWEMVFEEPTEPSTLDATWELLGYDVGDKYFTSGLSNCGYEAKMIETARREWGLTVNSDGLFLEIAVARRFKDFVEQRVPSHAPFYIFGIYRVPKGVIH
jgi:hypothetical protein